MNKYKRSAIILACIAIHGAGRARVSDELVQSNIKGLRSKDESVRLVAAQRLGDLGPHAVEAVPALVKAMDEPEIEVASAVCTALNRVGHAAIPSLVQIMGDVDASEKIRWYAAEALADLGPDALPHLVKAMDAEDVAVRMMAIDSLPRVGIAAETAVPKITEFLGGTNTNLTQSSVVSFAQIAALSADPGKSLAFKSLLNAAKSEDAALRRAVVSAFEFMGDKIGPAIPALKEATQDPDEEVRDNAAWLLNKLKIEY